jgi:hypothetical protein
MNYEMTSKKSLLLDILDAVNRFLQRAGGVFTLVSAAGVVGVMGSGTLTARKMKEIRC